MADDTRHWVETVVEDCLSKIRAHGFTVVGVVTGPHGATPQFAYTVGVSVTRGFELAISGLPIETMHDARNTLARRALDDADSFVPSDGLLVDGVFAPPFQPRLNQAHETWPFGMIRRALGPSLRLAVWQAQFPDIGCRYPGDAEYAYGPERQTDFTQPKAGGR